jgi:hypothetical protein
MKQQTGLSAFATCRAHSERKLDPPINGTRTLTHLATELKQHTLGLAGGFRIVAFWTKPLFLKQQDFLLKGGLDRRK